jgi:hypothetical protein
MALVKQPKSGNYLDALLGLWHGDKDSMGWVSSTLACEIARVIKPANPIALGVKIYGDKDGIPTWDREILKAIDVGYARYYKYYQAWNRGK